MRISSPAETGGQLTSETCDCVCEVKKCSGRSRTQMRLEPPVWSPPWLTVGRHLILIFVGRPVPSPPRSLPLLAAASVGLAGPLGATIGRTTPHQKQKNYHGVSGGRQPPSRGNWGWRTSPEKGGTNGDCRPELVGPQPRPSGDQQPSPTAKPIGKGGGAKPPLLFQWALR